ncbi:hypothetical protein [Leptolyngbya sp. O-77]|uniref:hypothetical protein n=1 Tax=Leptolyngbya sp. O-77 TaxID=1080068 RepID=UPI000838DB19|nr:hypothetical protein [Leptolyngbya sp. O-77]
MEQEKTSKNSKDDSGEPKTKLCVRLTAPSSTEECSRSRYELDAKDGAKQLFFSLGRSPLELISQKDSCEGVL